MTIGEGRNKNCPVDRELCLPAQLSFRHNVAVKRLQYCSRCSDSPANLSLHSPLTREQDPEVLKLLHLGLRQMPAELLQFPTRVLKVRVAGFRAPSKSQERECLPYSPEWSLKAVHCMIDLLHGNVTASVLANEPELTVLLYDEKGQPLHMPLVDQALAELD